MGYTTSFTGEFTVTPRLSAEHAAYLRAFADTRRVCRDEAKTALRPDPIREAVGLPVGTQGCYFVGAGGFYGQEYDAPDIINGNQPPIDQPELWCRWTTNEDDTAIVWDEDEKFYSYVEWLRYLISNFLSPWDYRLNGRVEWQGEDATDAGIIDVANNVVTVQEYKRVLMTSGDEGNEDE